MLTLDAALTAARVRANAENSNYLVFANGRFTIIPARFAREYEDANPAELMVAAVVPGCPDVLVGRAA